MKWDQLSRDKSLKILLKGREFFKKPFQIFFELGKFDDFPETIHYIV